MSPDRTRTRAWAASGLRVPEPTRSESPKLRWAFRAPTKVAVDALDPGQQNPAVSHQPQARRCHANANTGRSWMPLRKGQS